MARIDEPLAVVLRRRGGMVLPASGKGFSLSEIGELKLSVGSARDKGIPVDGKRRTKHEENVERLKAWIETIGEARPRRKFIIAVKRRPGRILRGVTRRTSTPNPEG